MIEAAARPLYAAGAVCVSADGDLIMAGSADGAVTLISLLPPNNNNNNNDDNNTNDTSDGQATPHTRGGGGSAATRWRRAKSTKNSATGGNTNTINNNNSITGDHRTDITTTTTTSNNNSNNDCLVWSRQCHGGQAVSCVLLNSRLRMGFSCGADGNVVLHENILSPPNANQQQQQQNNNNGNTSNSASTSRVICRVTGELRTLCFDDKNRRLFIAGDSLRCLAFPSTSSAQSNNSNNNNNNNNNKFEITSLNPQIPHPIISVCLSPCGQFLAAANAAGSVSVQCVGPLFLSSLAMIKQQQQQQMNGTSSSGNNDPSAAEASPLRLPLPEAQIKRLSAARFTLPSAVTRDFARDESARLRMRFCYFYDRLLLLVPAGGEVAVYALDGFHPSQLAGAGAAVNDGDDTNEEDDDNNNSKDGKNKGKKSSKNAAFENPTAPLRLSRVATLRAGASLPPADPLFHVSAYPVGRRTLAVVLGCAAGLYVGKVIDKRFTMSRYNSIVKGADNAGASLLPTGHDNSNGGGDDGDGFNNHNINNNASTASAAELHQQQQQEQHQSYAMLPAGGAPDAVSDICVDEATGSVVVGLANGSVSFLYKASLKAHSASPAPNAEGGRASKKSKDNTRHDDNNSNKNEESHVSTAEEAFITSKFASLAGAAHTSVSKKINTSVAGNRSHRGDSNHNNNNNNKNGGSASDNDDNDDSSSTTSSSSSSSSSGSSVENDNASSVSSAAYDMSENFTDVLRDLKQTNHLTDDEILHMHDGKGKHNNSNNKHKKKSAAGDDSSDDGDDTDSNNNNNSNKRPSRWRNVRSERDYHKAVTAAAREIAIKDKNYAVFFDDEAEEDSRDSAELDKEGEEEEEEEEELLGAAAESAYMTPTARDGGGRNHRRGLGDSSNGGARNQWASASNELYNNHHNNINNNNYMTAELLSLQHACEDYYFQAGSTPPAPGDATQARYLAYNAVGYIFTSVSHGASVHFHDVALPAIRVSIKGEVLMGALGAAGAAFVVLPADEREREREERAAARRARREAHLRRNNNNMKKKSKRSGAARDNDYGYDSQDEYYNENEEGEGGWGAGRDGDDASDTSADGLLLDPEEAAAEAAEEEERRRRRRLTLYFRQFNAWGAQADWSVCLLPGETVRSVAVGAHYVAAATSRYLRLFTLQSGLETAVLSKYERVVTLVGCASERLRQGYARTSGADPLAVFFLSNNATAAEVRVEVLDVSSRTALVPETRVPLTEDFSCSGGGGRRRVWHQLAWAGWGEDGPLHTCDTAGVVRLLTHAWGGAWVPVYDPRCCSSLQQTQPQQQTHLWVWGASDEALYAYAASAADAPPRVVAAAPHRRRHSRHHYRNDDNEGEDLSVDDVDSDGGDDVTGEEDGEEARYGHSEEEAMRHYSYYPPALPGGLPTERVRLFLPLVSTATLSTSSTSSGAGAATSSAGSAGALYSGHNTTTTPELPGVVDLWQAVLRDQIRTDELKRVSPAYTEGIARRDARHDARVMRLFARAAAQQQYNRALDLAAALELRDHVKQCAVAAGTGALAALAGDGNNSNSNNNKNTSTPPVPDRMIRQLASLYDARGTRQRKCALPLQSALNTEKEKEALLRKLILRERQLNGNNSNGANNNNNASGGASNHNANNTNRDNNNNNSNNNTGGVGDGSPREGEKAARTAAASTRLNMTTNTTHNGNSGSKKHVTFSDDVTDLTSPPLAAAEGATSKANSTPAAAAPPYKKQAVETSITNNSMNTTTNNNNITTSSNTNAGNATTTSASPVKPRNPFLSSNNNNSNKGMATPGSASVNSNSFAAPHANNKLNPQQSHPPLRKQKTIAFGSIKSAAKMMNNNSNSNNNNNTNSNSNNASEKDSLHLLGTDDSLAPLDSQNSLNVDNNSNNNNNNNKDAISSGTPPPLPLPRQSSNQNGTLNHPHNNNNNGGNEEEKELTPPTSAEKETAAVNSPSPNGRVSAGHAPGGDDDDIHNNNNNSNKNNNSNVTSATAAKKLFVPKALPVSTSSTTTTTTSAFSSSLTSAAPRSHDDYDYAGGDRFSQNDAAGAVTVSSLLSDSSNNNNNNNNNNGNNNISMSDKISQYLNKRSREEEEEEDEEEGGIAVAVPRIAL